MYIEKRDISDIYIVEENHIPSLVNQCSYLSKGTYEWIYIVSPEKKLVSKISFDDLTSNSKASTIPQNAIIRDKLYTTLEIEQLFITTGYSHIPIVNTQNCLIGEYVNYSKELESFEYIRNQYALSLMVSFPQAFRDYLAQEQVASVAVVIDKTSKYTLRTNIPSIHFYTPDTIDLIPDDCIIIDSLFSDKLQHKIYAPSQKVLSMSSVMERVMLSIVLTFAQQNSIKLLFVQGPKKRTRVDENGNEQDLLKCLLNKDLVGSFSEGDEKYAAFLSSGKGIIAARDSITNGYYMISADEQTENLTIIDGDRIVNKDSTSDVNRAKIHFFGSCLCFGLCCRDGKTIPDRIQQLANKNNVPIEVLNHGLRNGKNEINDFMRFLDGKYGNSDICIFINRYPEDELDLLKESKVEIIDLEPYASNLRNDWFLDNSFHVNESSAQVFSNVIWGYIFQAFSSIPNDFQSFKDFKLREKIETNFPPFVNAYTFSSYLSKLRNIRNTLKIKQGSKIGSIIMTANPFTDGHKFLVEYARKLCAHVFVFIVQEDMFQIPYDLRLKIVKENLVDANNVTVIGTGEDLTSYLSFPEYFSKSSKNYNMDEIEISPLNNLLFGKYICPTLGITNRYLGEETDIVTSKYNEYVKYGLTEYGITVSIIPRAKTASGQAISASTIRAAIKNKTLTTDIGISETTKNILMEYYKC